MIFGKIDYINLLPFYVFMKKNLKNSSQRASFFNKKGVPSKINRDFRRRVIDVAFISSIRSTKSKCVDMGIVAKKEVRSVLVLSDEDKQRDSASETSNVLADILNINGKIIIGDMALKEFYKEQKKVDLALEWYKKHKLPFVFALACTNSCYKRVDNLKKRFLKAKIKIPSYILENNSRKTGIQKKIILEYLKLISYNIEAKEKISLKKFILYARISQKKVKA
jgi:chorismate dehydratase